MNDKNSFTGDQEIRRFLFGFYDAWQLTHIPAGASIPQIANSWRVAVKNLKERTGLGSCYGARMIGPDTPLDELTERIIGAAIEVHRTLGPGLLESVYQECLIVELRRCQLRVDKERHVPLSYTSGAVVTYLKLTGCPAGLLMNFNSIVLKSGLKRLDHPDLYVKRIFS